MPLFRQFKTLQFFMVFATSNDLTQILIILLEYSDHGGLYWPFSSLRPLHIHFNFNQFYEIIEDLTC